jgi:hypothetical protein
MLHLVNVSSSALPTWALVDPITRVQLVLGAKYIEPTCDDSVPVSPVSAPLPQIPSAVPVTNVQSNSHPLYDVDGLYDVLTDHLIVIDPDSATYVVLLPRLEVMYAICWVDVDDPSSRYSFAYKPVLDTEYRENVI